MYTVSHPNRFWKKSSALLLLSAVLLAGCVAPRVAKTDSDALGTVPRSAQPSSLASMAQPLAAHTDLTARMALQANYGDKQLPLKGNLRMRRGEVIQVAFTAMGMVEIARVELTPKKVFLIDRVGKQYATASFAELPALGNSLNYSLLESLLWNELFLPGQSNVATSLGLFTTQNVGSSLVIEPKTQQNLKCQFTADNDYRHLRQAQLRLADWVSTWDYSSFQRIGADSYPASIVASIEHKGKKASADFTFTNIAFDDSSWAAHTNISNYSQVSLDDFLARLSFLK